MVEGRDARELRWLSWVAGLGVEARFFAEQRLFFTFHRMSE